MFQAHFVYPEPVLASAISLGALVVLLENGVRSKIWQLGMLFTPGVSFLLGSLNWQSKEIYEPVYLYICVNIFMFTLWICMLNMNSYWCFQLWSITTWIILASSPCISVYFYSNGEKPGSYPLPFIYLIDTFQYTCIAVSELLIHTPTEKTLS